MMFLNTTSCFSNFEPSNIRLFDLTDFERLGVGVVIGVTALIGLVINMLFMYFIRYKAPKDRPINTLIFYDKVCLFLFIPKVLEF